MGCTPEENAQIDYVKRIITKIFATFRLPKSVAVIAMTELIVYTFSQDRKDVKELKEKINDWYEGIMLTSVDVMGPEYIKIFQEIEQLEKEQPGTIEAMGQLSNAFNSDVQVRFMKPEDMKNIPGDETLDGMPPVSTTKH